MTDPVSLRGALAIFYQNIRHIPLKITDILQKLTQKACRFR